MTAWSFIKDEARYLLTWGLALVLLLVSAGVVLVAAVLLLVMTSGRVEYRGTPACCQSTYGNRPVRPGPTTVPLPPVHLDRVPLIIQQNPTCWIGRPGATCD